LQSHNDGTTFTATEVAGTQNDLVVNFTSVTAFNWVQALLYYDGGGTHAHALQLEITPFDGSTWETFGHIDHQASGTNAMDNYSFFITKTPSTYINSGVVKVRIIHLGATANNHTLVIDEIGLYQ
jgi:hypothetical protein